MACQDQTYPAARTDRSRPLAAVREAIAGIARRAGRRLVERKAATTLLRMDDSLLRDIGLTRADAEWLARNGLASADRVARRIGEGRPRPRAERRYR